MWALSAPLWLAAAPQKNLWHSRCVLLLPTGAQALLRACPRHPDDAAYVEAVSGRRMRLCLQLLTVAHLLLGPALGYFPNEQTQEGNMPERKGSERLFQPKLWRVDSARGLLTIVLPLLPHHEELAMFEVQVKSMAALFNSSSVQEFVLIVPAAGLPALERFLQERILGHLTNLPIFTAVSDDAIAPDLRHARLRDSQLPDVGVPGWVKQQLLKLAVSGLVQTPYYLVLDTDILFATRFSALQLFRMSECSQIAPVCDTIGHVAFHAKTDVYDLAARSGNEQDWRASTAAFLQLELPGDLRFATGSTPQIYATDIAHQLGPWLQQRFGVTRWQSFLLDGLTGVFTEGNQWRMPWTEHNLYWLFAHHVGAWGLFHTHGHLLQDKCVWSEADFDGWQPCLHLSDKRRGYFCTVASHLGISAAKVWKKLEPCISHSRSVQPGASATDAHAASYLRRQ